MGLYHQYLTSGFVLLYWSSSHDKIQKAMYTLDNIVKSNYSGAIAVVSGGHLGEPPSLDPIRPTGKVHKYDSTIVETGFDDAVTPLLNGLSPVAIRFRNNPTDPSFGFHVLLRPIIVDKPAGVASSVLGATGLDTTLYIPTAQSSTYYSSSVNVKANYAIGSAITSRFAVYPQMIFPGTSNLQGQFVTSVVDSDVKSQQLTEAALSGLTSGSAGTFAVMPVTSKAMGVLRGTRYVKYFENISGKDDGLDPGQGIEFGDQA